MKDNREINEFRSLFAFLKDRPVTLYGTGQYTQLLLQQLKDFHFVALMDQAKVERYYYGLPVLSVQEVANSSCEAVIIAANLSVAPAIYQRIRCLEQKGIAVYYMNGRRPAEAQWQNIEPLWPGGAEQIIDLAEKYDVISFDLFDTLIMRKCLLPEEIFFIVSQRMGLDVSFPEQRQRAEKTLYHGGTRFYNLNDIYNQMKEDATVQQMEIAVEQEMIQPREDMVRLYHRLHDMGKQVIITSDMYLSSEQLRPILSKCGIGDAVMYISNEQESSKHLGTLYPRIQSIFPGKRILHIGDNPRCDVENAKREGISGLQIESASTLMKRYGLNNLQTAIYNDAGRHMYELFASKCFSSAFCRDKSGKILISDPRVLGYLFFGPLAAGYLAWLMDQVREHEIGHILFVSRDGWLFYQLYQNIQKRDKTLPRADYFLTSRRCVSVASVRTTEDVRFVLENVCYSRSMSFGEMLEKAYGLAANPKERLAGGTLSELGIERVWKILQNDYLEQILNHAAMERERYLRYINSLKISGEQIGMMNFVGRGVTQRCLQAILGQKLNGYYFALEYDSSQILDAETKAFTWYPELLSTHIGRRKLSEQLLLGETVFSAPHGAVAAFTESGEPIYEKTSESRAALVTACQEGIIEYLEDILQLNGGLEGLQANVDMADRMFGLLCDGRFLLSDEIKTSFHFEDLFQ